MNAKKQSAAVNNSNQSTTKQISLVFTQVNKVKGDETTSVIRTRTLAFQSDVQAYAHVCSLLDNVYTSVKIAMQLGSASVQLDGQRFNFKRKFALSVVVDGIEYKHSDIDTIFGGLHLDFTFRKSQQFGTALYQILRTAEGQSPLLDTATAEKIARTLSNEQLKLS